MTGYIRLFRQMIKWEWYTDIPTKVLFLHLLLSANYEDKKWRGVLIKKGELVTSYANLAKQCGLTVKQVRTALQKLKSTGEVAHKGQGSYSIISIKNWSLFQIEGNLRARQGQGEGKARATTKEIKKEKNEEIENVEINGYIREEKNRKTDPFINPVIRIFKDEYSKIFNNKPYLTAIERNKIVGLCADIEDFTQTIPVVLGKMKNIDFGFENWKPTASWLLKDSNYTAILNGAYDKQAKRSFFDELREKERLKNGTT